MSETYISDKVNVFRGDAKSEAKNQWYSGSWLDREREALSISIIPGKKISRQMMRIHQAEMSPIDTFKQAMIRLIDKGIIDMRESEFLEIVSIMTGVEDIQYRNPLAIVLAYSLLNAKTEEEVKKITTKGEENDIPTFDIIRYMRYLSMLSFEPNITIRVSIPKKKNKK
jgi:hypothetical protein